MNVGRVLSSARVPVLVGAGGGSRRVQRLRAAGAPGLLPAPDDVLLRPDGRRPAITTWLEGTLSMFAIR